jgi:Holliday junction resolvase RusA-like endonuclease
LSDTPQPDPDRVTFTVQGWPAQKGSFIPLQRGEKLIVIPQSNQALRDWTKIVVMMARQAMGRRELFSGPLRIYSLFSLHKPKSTTEPYPSQKGRHDLDKYERALWDALTDVIMDDDGRIVDTQAKKRWALGIEGLPFPGARITVEKLRPAALIGAGE